MGKPVVVTATAGQRDVIENGITGVMVPPGDPRTLQEVITFLLSAPHERRRLGENAREAARTTFGLDDYADRLVSHLGEIAAPGDRADGARAPLAVP